MMNAFDLSIRLRAFRESAGFTDRQAAEALGITYSTFCGLKNQRGGCSSLVLAEIERRLSGCAILNPLDRPAPPETPTIEPAQLAAMLNAWREKGGLTRRAIAHALGVSITTLKSWERCRTKAPHPSTLQRIVPILSSPPGEQPPTPRRITGRLDPRFGPRLHAWRKASRLNQAQACEILGIAHKTELSCYERCRTMPSAKRLASIEQIIASGPILTARAHADVSLPQRLLAWRRANGLLQREAAARFGVDAALLCDYERGDALPRSERRAKIEAIIAGTDALAPALADIEQLKATLVRAHSLRTRLESRLQRADRWIGQLQARLDRREREVASLRAQP